MAQTRLDSWIDAQNIDATHYDYDLTDEETVAEQADQAWREAKMLDELWTEYELHGDPNVLARIALIAGDDVVADVLSEDD